MNKTALTKRRGISPIIATLLLILIAIAAEVVVYAYVIGFIGNSTANGGTTTDTLSIDQLTLSSKATTSAATAYVRNLGPTSEAFNTGFYVKSATLNLQLSPAMTISTSTSYFTSIASVASTYTSATTISLSVTGVACNAAGGTLTITEFGINASSVSGKCPATAGSVTGTIVLPMNYAITSTFAAGASGIGTFSATFAATNPTTLVIGTPITAGSISVPIGNVITLSLTEIGLQVTGTPGSTQFNNPLTPGQTYTVQVIGTDGGSATSSARAS